mmetsp:Transcript_7452/g.11722  ORF Transcript_7452/g.11722 Transcript_7452/m.11722 type:complete len:180 (-) Transcript_7452:835-1374(-)|eukprot:CAMPEP_0184305318 /NCGR_PEP_ID=MMETSP1049-20130417/14629_1 /TAXON_ID=77928 /ORGANISM="Proteomonas sulcata, Strain CCMP704" /LENGTH=179 /DNA_ID=CAMNT_0026617359 /DNA_START=204 /DNA_END=743 /DNA_ORIENTATION=+
MKFAAGFLLAVAGTAEAFAPQSAGLPLRQASRQTTCAPQMSVPVGEKFPDEVAQKLGVKGKNAVVYFYPSDATPGCTKEAQAFNDALGEFNQLKFDVVGVSSDKTAKEDFKAQFGQRMVADVNDEARKALGIKADLFGVLPGRETYVVGKDGKVAMCFNNQFSPEEHASKALEVAKGMA